MILYAAAHDGADGEPVAYLLALVVLVEVVDVVVRPAVAGRVTDSGGHKQEQHGWNKNTANGWNNSELLKMLKMLYFIFLDVLPGCRKACTTNLR